MQAVEVDEHIEKLVKEWDDDWIIFYQACNGLNAAGINEGGSKSENYQQKI